MANLILLIQINQQINTVILRIILLIKKLINADYSDLTEKIETNPKAPKFKVNDVLSITKYQNIFNKSYTEYWSRKIFIIDIFEN